MTHTRERLAWSVAALAVVVAVGIGGVTTWTRATPDTRVVRLTVQPEGANSVFGYSVAVSPDGGHVAFVGAGDAGASTLWSVTGDGANAVPEPGTPKPLFDARLVGGFTTALGFRSQYDVAPDGQRFLVNLETGSADVPITVVVNWTAALRK